MTKQNTPLTNVIEWIDERIEQLKEINSAVIKEDLIEAKISDLKLLRNRIIQELQNERDRIEQAYTNGNRLEVYDATEMICKIYFTQTYKTEDDKNNQNN